MPLPVNMMTGMESMKLAADVGTQVNVRANLAAETANKYADLRKKMQDITQRDMEMEVLEQEQGGKMAEAQLYTERSNASLDNIGVYKNADKAAITEKAQSLNFKLSDQQRLEVAKVGGTVNDPQSHERAYNTLIPLAESMNSTPEEMFGVKKEYNGAETLDRWAFAKDIGLATQKFMQSERVGAAKHIQSRDTANVLRETNLERDFQNFQYDMILQNMRSQASLETAAIKAKRGIDLKRGDIESMPPNQVAPAIGMFLSGITDLEADDSELVEEASNMSIQVSKEVDAAWIEYTKGNRVEPLTQGEAIEKVMSELQGRVGTDGDLHNEGSTKLGRQKTEWMDKWKSEAITISDRFSTLPEAAQKAYAEAAWSNPEARQERE